MNIHQSLILFYKALGLEAQNNGICQGFTIRWIEALLLGTAEKERFIARVQEIHSMVLTAIENARKNNAEIKEMDDAVEAELKKLIQQKFSGTPKEIEIMAFFHSIAVFLNPQAYIKPHVQQHIEKISKIGSSKGIEDQGGLKQIFCTSHSHAFIELKKFLNNLAKILDQFPENDPFPLILNNFDHAITLSYSKTQGWTFMDVNLFSEREDIAKENTQRVVELIFKSLGRQPHEYLVFCATLLTTKTRHDSQPQIAKELLLLECEYLLLLESEYQEDASIAFRCSEENKLKDLFLMAARQNNTPLMRLMMTFNPSQEKIAEAIKMTARLGHHETLKVILDNLPAHNLVSATIAALQQAVETGQGSVLNLLYNQYQVPLNARFHFHKTAAHIAAEQGQGQFLEHLHALGADLKCKDFFQKTVAHYAVQSGELDVIRSLKKLNINFFEQDNSNKTAIDYARQFQKKELIDFLVKVTAADDKEEKGNPVFIAAKKANNYARQHIATGYTQMDNNLLDGEVKRALVQSIHKARDLIKEYPFDKNLSELEKKVLTFYQEISAAKKSSLGNCYEMACMALNYMVQYEPNINAEVFSIDNGDHVILVINRNPDSDANDPKTWGQQAYICDPWSNNVYPASDYLSQLKCFKSVGDINRGEYENTLSLFNPQQNKLKPQEYINSASIKAFHSKKAKIPKINPIEIKPVVIPIVEQKPEPIVVSLPKPNS